MANQNQNRTQEPQQEGYANPKWAQQFEAAAEKLSQAAATLAPRLPVAVKDSVSEDRESWTTPEQAEEFDSMVGKDFFKLDEKREKIVDPQNLYRVTHVYPEFQTVNTAEFKAKFVVEQFRWEKVKGQQSNRKIIGSFNLHAKDFRANYRQTTPDPVSVDS